MFLFFAKLFSILPVNTYFQKVSGLLFFPLTWEAIKIEFDDQVVLPFTVAKCKFKRNIPT